MTEVFKKASKYDPEWIKSNMMGPNSIYLLERLTEKMNLKPGMRVLDLGCGRGITSVFLAKEFGVQVWATDLWISATDNYKRFVEAGVEEHVFALHAEAHNLPYATGFFDAIISIDAYHYFGTEDEYLDTHCGKLIKPGGEMGIVVPGTVKELDKGEIPKGLESFWEEEFSTFHSPEWWMSLWNKSRLINSIKSMNIPDGKKIWYESIWQQGKHGSDSDREILNADRENILTLIMVLGKRV